MTYLVCLLALVAIPLTVGYVFGRNDVDPDSEAGREYYRKEDYDYV